MGILKEYLKKEFAPDDDRLKRLVGKYHFHGCKGLYQEHWYIGRDYTFSIKHGINPYILSP